MTAGSEGGIKEEQDHTQICFASEPLLDEQHAVDEVFLWESLQGQSLMNRALDREGGCAQDESLAPSKQFLGT